MMDYQEQLRFKQKKIEDNLQRIGGFGELPMEPIIGMKHPFRYRNKAQFPVGTDKNGALVTGFYAGRTHDIIPARNCWLGVEENQQVLDAVLAGWRNSGSPLTTKRTEPDWCGIF